MIVGHKMNETGRRFILWPGFADRGLHDNDHLGNVRSVVKSSGTVLQSTDYYPFGLAFSDANVTNNRYFYSAARIRIWAETTRRNIVRG